MDRLRFSDQYSPCIAKLKTARSELKVFLIFFGTFIVWITEYNIYRP